jgi:hypothetical protein
LPVEERLKLLDAALAARGDSPEPTDAPTVSSFEEAVAAYAPSLTITEDFPRGSRVERVGVVMGRQRLGALEAPLVRAVWMRTAL